MFGHDDKNENTEEHVTADAGQVVQPMSTTPPDENVVGVAAPATAPATPTTDDDDDGDISKIVDDINATTDDQEKPEATTAPAAPVEAPAEEPAEEAVPDLAPAAETPEEPEDKPAESIVDEPADEPTVSEMPAELLEVKKSALQELSPLLDELDQTADEKLNILMMTIQATDDQALLPQALATAKQIDDKKARAEAMLDIIQEINYFTKKK